MKKRTRKFVFLLFLFAFVAAAPLVVLYTAGYRYHFGTGHIVQTGVLSLASVPRGASIVIDGTVMRATTPSLVKNVLPGTHFVRVQKEGFSPWEKRLHVESRSTTFADDVVLFFEESPILVRATSLGAVSVSPNDARAVYAKTQGNWTEVWMYDPLLGEDTLVSRLPVDDAGSIRFAWQENGSILAIRTLQKGEDIFTLIETNTGAPAQAHVPEIAWAAVGEHVVVSRQTDGSNTILAYLPPGSYELRDAPIGILMFEDSGRGRVILVESTGGDRPILLNANATQWRWEPGGRRLVYSDGFDLHVYDPAAHTDETITRLSSAITGVSWYPGHASVLFAQADAIYSVELDQRDRRNVTKLISGSALGAFEVDPGGRVLYFFGMVDGETGLFSRTLQP